MPAATPLYPLKFRPIYKSKVWGGRHLEKLGRTLPPPASNLIGESWELADLSSTSPTGGGGGAERSIVANGPLAGQSLHDLILLYGEQLLGRVQLTPAGEFPLLVKFLDARQHLSVQVHPSEAYARQHASDPSVHLKSEAWYIVHAEPGAAIYKGIREGVTRDQFRTAIAAGTVDAVEPLLIKVPVKAGDCHYLPSGTCHALGAGILAAEVQTPSDTTYRLFDWGRTDRALHVDQAMAAMEFGPPPSSIKHIERRSHIAGMFTTVTRLVLCDHFRIEKVRMSESYEQEIPYDQPAIWMVLQGKGRLTPGNGAEAVPFTQGETILIPAGMDNARVHLDADTVWIETTFPKALPDQIA
ncbi:MAG: class I mannose-6-phosphate isomerase [Planctomycetes bacterium]|nr:class I mannose-6-phosphate isomerase [Planctomycetota bacterium]